MNLELKRFNEILFLDLQPWNNTDVTEVKFKELLHDVPKEHYTHQPSFEVDFPKPLTAKRKYYHSIIENEAVKYLNQCEQMMSSSINENEKTYWVNKIIIKKLQQTLKETNETIIKRSYYFENFQSKETEEKVLEGIYIFQYLRQQLVRIYMEIQSSYANHLKDNVLTEEELQQTYFPKDIIEKSFIKEAQKFDLGIHTINKVQEEPITTTFNAIKGDFRGTSKGILPYESIVKNPARFASFEEQLFQQGYIDENYKFTDSHGQKQEMAAIYHQLIKKGYFNQRTFKPQKPIKNLEIRKFLDFRYNSNLDKQFRTLENDPDGLAKLIESQYWLTKLPTS